MQHHAGAVVHHGRRKHRELCAGYGLPVRSDGTMSRPGRQRSKFRLRVSSQKVIPLGNEKFTPRRSHAMSATESGYVAFDSLDLSRLAKGTMSSGSCSPIVAWQGVERTSRCCYVDPDDSVQDRKARFPENDTKIWQARCHTKNHPFPEGYLPILD